MTNQTTFDRYEIESKIADGGMATVYLAHDPRFGRKVALKVLSLVYKDEPKFRERFEREARTVASLEHRAIVPVYDFGEDHDQLFLVMRYMPGGSLADRITLKPFAPETAVPIIRRIASALDHAHQHGVIHRDLKPANILFDQYNNAFLSDFGIVKLAAEATTTGLTGSGVIGTPAYMSPEQIHGDQTLDGRSDIYTLGIILFEMLTGFKPYRADTPVKQMMAHVLNPIPNIRKYNPLLPPECEALMLKAMAKERAERFTTAEALHLALTNAATGVFVLPAVAVSSQRSNFVENDAPMNTAVPVPQDPLTLVSSTAAQSVSSPNEDPPTLIRNREKSSLRWHRMLPIIALLFLLGVGLIIWSNWDGTGEDGDKTAVPAIVAAVNPTQTATAAPTGTRTPEPTQATTAVSTPDTDVPQPLTIGMSASGEPISAVQFGTGERVAIFVGGIHAGWAPASVTLAEAVIAYLTENADLVPADLTVIVIPNLNPDSEPVPGELNGRLNGNGVDLNRNWDCNWRSDPLWRDIPGAGLGGSAPFSEPEVAALRDLIVSQNTEAVIFWQARVQGGLVSPGSCGTQTTVSQAVASIYGAGAGYLVTDFESLADQEVNGDSTNWLDAQGIPAVSVLLPDYDVPDLEKNLAGVLAILENVSNN
ncbi:MAG: protein kinase [Anaerolineales bacterium]|nr:protein kinase [Anaerolineales bacterium]